MTDLFSYSLAAKRLYTYIFLNMFFHTDVVITHKTVVQIVRYMQLHCRSILAHFTAKCGHFESVLALLLNQSES